jgi:ABC-type branched-subunit amino acid transport system substrate-binding protein
MKSAAHLFLMPWLTLSRLGACWMLAWISAGAWAQDLVVGQLASATNPLTRVIAAEYTQGIALGLRHVNAEGGVQGRSVKLVTYDDNFEPARTLQGAQQLVEKEGAVALVGGMGTQTTMQLVNDRFLERHQIANFAPLTGLNQALSAPNVFPVRASFDDEVRAMLAHAANLQREKVAFIYLEAGAGPALSRQVADWARAAKVRLVANVGFKSAADAQAQSTAIGAALATLGTERPDAAILIAVGAPYAAMVKALRERLGGWMPIHSLGQVTVDALIQAVGAPTARNVSLTQVMPSPRSVDLRITRDFAEDRLRWAPQLPKTYIALEGYVAARVLCEVLKRAKPLTREGVLAASLGAGDLNVAGFRVQYHRQGRRSLQPVDMTLLDREARLIR